MGDVASIVPKPLGSLRAFARGIELPDEEGRVDPKRPPTRQMMLMLGVAKRRGTAFELAWAKAWENIAWPHPTEQRREWKVVLSVTREVWRDAYEDRDPAARLVSISAIQALEMHEFPIAA